MTHATALRYGRVQCESPIEELLLVGMLADLSFRHNTWLRTPTRGVPLGERVPPGEFGGHIVLEPQRPVGRYRADFALYLASSVWLDQPGHLCGFCDVTESHLLAIECDGHDYHERTQAQASRDRRRDREFFTRGIPVLRFTGREIHADPLGCATEAIDALLLHAQRGSHAHQGVHGA